MQPHDIGQMNLYLGYFASEENGDGDNPPIGIILSRNKNELLVKYATYQMISTLFVQKYQLYRNAPLEIDAQAHKMLQ